MGQDFGYHDGRIVKRIEESQKQTENEEYNRLLDMFAASVLPGLIARFPTYSEDWVIRKSFAYAREVIKVRKHYAR